MVRKTAIIDGTEEGFLTAFEAMAVVSDIIAIYTEGNTKLLGHIKWYSMNIYYNAYPIYLFI